MSFGIEPLPLYEVWLGEELPGLDGEAESFEAAKGTVEVWLEGDGAKP